MRLRGSKSPDRGASLVEVSIILPLLLALAIGLAEIGFLVVDYITVSNAARSGARTGSAAADDPSADDFILNVVEEAACNLRFGNLERVTIYKPESDGSKPADLNLINVHEHNGVDTSTLLCQSDAHALTPATGCCPWSSTTRVRVPPNFDTLGVEVEFSYSGVTGLLPLPTITWRETAIMQIEPDTRN